MRKLLQKNVKALSFERLTEKGFGKCHSFRHVLYVIPRTKRERESFHDPDKRGIDTCTLTSQKKSECYRTLE